MDNPECAAIPIKGQTQRLTVYLDTPTYAWLVRMMDHAGFISLSKATGYLLDALKLKCEQSGEGPLGWAQPIYERQWELDRAVDRKRPRGDSPASNLVEFPALDPKIGGSDVSA